MPNENFLAPKYNECKESDPQIIRVPLDDMGFGARKSALPTSISGSAQDNSMTIKHVGEK